MADILEDMFSVIDQLSELRKHEPLGSPTRLMMTAAITSLLDVGISLGTDRPLHRIVGRDANGDIRTWTEGQTILRKGIGDRWVEDTVIAGFYQTVTLQPYAPNEKYPAVILKRVSWLPTSQILTRTGEQS